MDETYYAGAYWTARKESVEECARRAQMLLATLPTVDASFASWFKQGKSRKDALKHAVKPSMPELEDLIRRGRDRVFEDLGFRFGAWNGADDEYDGSAFRVTCGGYTEAVSNTCVFTLPSRGPNASRVLTTPALSRLVQTLAMAWEPEWAVATSSSHRDSVTATPKAGTFVGWIMYLSRHRGTVPPLPAPVLVEPVADKGTLIVLTPERFTASNPEHVALAEQVRALLDQAGLLKPL
ncbi:hypothetical protein MFUL124B02_14050 [Myxococcus fulvus 124B02]|nr:hypothetical protein MFUL124B02_14050 [Myxococcus fulvus 124B02]